MNLHINIYSNIIFDCDGVILDSNKIKERNIYKVSSKYLFESKLTEFIEYFNSNPGIPREGKIEKYIHNKSTITNILKEYNSLNLESLKTANLVNGVKNFILSLNNNQIRKSLAINEVSILRQSRQAASLSIKHGSKQIIKKLVSDGVLVSTPAGSTAYNLSVHGPILSLNSKKLSIAPISPFRPRRWKGKIVSDKLKITITNLNPSKRPISAVADNLEVRNAKSITVKTNNKIKFNLLYDKNRSLQKKIKIEQLRKETR